MCHILPIDHLTCAHTIALWQYCYEAPCSRTTDAAPCTQIPEHAQHILTAKRCHNCGEPRYQSANRSESPYFRLERDGTSPVSASECQRKGSLTPDSGYHSISDVGCSDAADENDNDDAASSMSPTKTRKTWTPTSAAIGKPSTPTRKPARPVGPTRKASWHPPKLKDALNEEVTYTKSVFPSRESSITKSDGFEDGIGRAQASKWPSFSEPKTRERRNATITLEEDVESDEVRISVPSVMAEDENINNGTSFLTLPTFQPLDVLADLPTDFSALHFASNNTKARPQSFGKGSTHLRTSLLPPPRFSTAASSCYSLSYDPITASDDEDEGIKYDSAGEDDYEEYSFATAEDQSASYIMATTAKMARASRISFHGTNLRIVRQSQELSQTAAEEPQNGG